MSAPEPAGGGAGDGSRGVAGPGRRGTDRAGRQTDPAARGDMTPFIRAVGLTARTIVSCLTRVRLEGPLDRIPREGPLILASNHLSNADGPVIGGWLTPALGRRIHWLGKREMYDWPLAGPVLRAVSIHPVDRGGADVETFRFAERILAAGNVLLVFPEGTRSTTGGLQRPRDGLALLALRSGAPILPVAVAGTERLWPRGTVPHVGGRVILRVGEAFRVADALGSVARDRRVAKGMATDLIMRRIAALLPSRYRGVYVEAEEETGDDPPILPPEDPAAEA